MILCAICNEGIFDNGYINCSECKIFLHFACAGSRETSFKNYTATRKKS